MEIQQEKMEQSKKALFKIGLAVLALALVGGGYYFYTARFSKGRVERISANLEKITPAAGQTASGFPREFLIEPARPILESYALNYLAAGQTQTTASYISKLNLAQNIEAFGKYTAASGWTIIKQPKTGQPVTFLYAVKNRTDLNILFESQPSGEIKVTISQTAER